MDRANTGNQVPEQSADKTQEMFSELNDLELAVVGGGIGETIL